jgi:hypothetical protein
LTVPKRVSTGPTGHAHSDARRRGQTGSAEPCTPAARTGRRRWKHVGHDRYRRGEEVERSPTRKNSKTISEAVRRQERKSSAAMIKHNQNVPGMLRLAMRPSTCRPSPDSYH